MMHDVSKVETQSKTPHGQACEMGDKHTISRTKEMAHLEGTETNDEMNHISKNPLNNA